MNHMKKSEFIKLRSDGKIKAFGQIAPYGNSEAYFLNNFGCYVGVTDAVSELTVIMKNIANGEQRNNIIGILIPDIDTLDRDTCAKFTGVDASFFHVCDLKDNTKELKTVE